MYLDINKVQLLIDTKHVHPSFIQNMKLKGIRINILLSCSSSN